MYPSLFSEAREINLGLSLGLCSCFVDMSREGSIDTAQSRLSGRCSHTLKVHSSHELAYCKFGNFREGFNFAKLRKCEVS